MKSLSTLPHRMTCSICGKEWTTRSLKAFTQTMRRHRDKVHPDEKAPIRYHAKRLEETMR